MSEAILVELTDDQAEKLNPAFSALEDGGAVFAQVYVDNCMRVKVFDADTAKRTQQAIGSVEDEYPMSAYGKEVHERQASIKQQRDELLAALKAARATLARENENNPSPICDTIWHTSTETLFNFMDAAIAKAEA